VASKFYEHGLRFEYKSAATLDTPVPLKMQAQPPAKVIQDPFYNEPRAIHDKGGEDMYASTKMHQGVSGPLETYINHTVRSGEEPSAEGLKKHIEK